VEHGTINGELRVVLIHCEVALPALLRIDDEIHSGSERAAAASASAAPPASAATI
jgi:hypothetical protein